MNKCHVCKNTPTMSDCPCCKKSIAAVEDIRIIKHWNNMTPINTFVKLKSTFKENT